MTTAGSTSSPTSPCSSREGMAVTTASIDRPALTSSLELRLGELRAEWRKGQERMEQLDGAGTSTSAGAD
jgi:hypothetical protein